MKSHNYLSLFLFISSSFSFAVQYPDLANLYHGVYNFNSSKIIMTDTVGSINYGTFYIVYNSNKLPDSIVHQSGPFIDTLPDIYSFTYYPADRYFTIKCYWQHIWPPLTTLDKMYYNQEGQITHDSTFDYETNSLLYTFQYFYNDQGKISKQIKDFSALKNSWDIWIWADTTQWIYNYLGRIDSIRSVLHFGDMVSVYSYYPVYNNDGTIEKTLVYYYDGEIGEELFFYYHYFYGQVPIHELNHSPGNFPTPRKNDIRSILCSSNLLSSRDIEYSVYNLSGRRLDQSPVGKTLKGYYLLKFVNEQKVSVVPFYLVK